MKRDPSTGAPDFYSFARDYLHTYLPTIRGLSPKTIEAYRISLECFLDYLAEHEHIERAQRQLRPLRPPAPQGLAGLDDRSAALRAQDGHVAAERRQSVPGLRSDEDLTLVALSQAAKALKAPASPRRPIEYLTEPETRADPRRVHRQHREIAPQPDAADPALRHRRPRRRDHRPDPAGPAPDRARAHHAHRQGQQDPHRAAHRARRSSTCTSTWTSSTRTSRHCLRPAVVLQPAPRAA